MKWLTLANGIMARKETTGERISTDMYWKGSQDAQISTTVSFFVDGGKAKRKAH
jgi:hypothetical protein